ncbi:hypothetical protein LINPERHAP1_LOCUS23246, partial [Linum perenne]
MIRLRLYEAFSPNRRLPFDLPTRSSLLLFINCSHQLLYFFSFSFPSFFPSLSF